MIFQRLKATIIGKGALVIKEPTMLCNNSLLQMDTIYGVFSYLCVDILLTVNYTDVVSK